MAASATGIVLFVAVAVVVIVIVAIYKALCRSVYAAAEWEIRKDLSDREDQLLRDRRSLRNDMQRREDDFKNYVASERKKLDNDRQAVVLLRNKSIDAEVDQQLAIERIQLKEEYSALRAELRSKAEGFLNKVQQDQADLAEQKQKAEDAEREFRDEYEKWKSRNRDDGVIEDDIELSPDQMAAFGFIKETGRNYFIQGRAGTGKSRLVQYLKTHLKRHLLLASPTSAAAKIIGGVTIHSLFRLPAKDFIIIKNLKPPNQWTKELLCEADTLIIDEVSMVSPDILDAVDHIAKRARNNGDPFGGLQVVLIGDLFQLPPVITSGAEAAFKSAYGHANAYFFDASAYKAGGFCFRLLSTVHRQNDPELLEYLSNILRGENLEEALAYFNSAKIADSRARAEATIITTHNRNADRLNSKRLAEIDAPERVYEGEVMWGDYDPEDAPPQHKLILKKGAFVIFTNNFQKIINGTRGVVVDLGDNIITVRFLENNQEMGIKRDTWTNYEYEVDRHTGEIEEVEKGQYTQFPLQLGYAMTIHKAQGMTLDYVIIDKVHSNFFAHGQLYVALTRTRTRAGMHIRKKLQVKDIRFDKRIIDALQPIVAQTMKDVIARTVSDDSLLLSLSGIDGD